jgi:hypothetical protein
VSRVRFFLVVRSQPSQRARSLVLVRFVTNTRQELQHLRAPANRFELGQFLLAIRKPGRAGGPLSPSIRQSWFLACCLDVVADLPGYGLDLPEIRTRRMVLNNQAPVS